MNALKTGLKTVAALGASLALAASLSVTAPEDALAQKKQLSEKAVKYIMNLTWSIMPKEIKGKDGKKVAINRAKAGEVEVPLEDARRVIMVARRSAHAQICKLPELQKKNYRTMIKLELDSKKWTRKQMVYLNQLHLFTVMWLTGNVSIVEDDGKGGEKEKKKKLPACAPKQKTEVKTQIEAYLKANPVIAKTAKKGK